MNLSDYVFRTVAAAGVKHVFMVPGGGAMHLNLALGRCPGITVVSNLHEQACAIAAEAYGKATNQLGVALVTTGPGGTNAVTGVAGAWLDSTPCLFISGQVKRADLGGSLGVRNLGVQEVDIVSIVKSITKYAVTVLDPATIRFHLEKAIHVARTGRPGPVWIDIPLDIQSVEIDPTGLSGFSSEPPVATPGLEAQVSKTIDLLNASERPVLFVGNGVRLGHAVPELFEAIDALGIPVLTTWLAHDIVPNDHPLFIGRPGSVAPRGSNYALQNSDFLLAIGNRLDLVITGYSHQNFARAARKVVVDIDPNELGKLQMAAELLVAADAKAFLAELLRQRSSIRREESRVPWLARCKEWLARYPVVTPEFRAEKGAVSTYVLADTLSDLLTPDDFIVSGSSGAAIEIFLLAYRVRAGQRVFVTSALGSMGFGLPAAIGACLGGGGRRTICAEGDGSLQLNSQELATLAHLQLPVKLFVLNNDGYSSIRTSQKRYFGSIVGCDPESGLVFPDTVRIAAAYGLRTATIQNQDNLAAELRSVLETPGPIVCDVKLPRDEIRAPSLASARRADGSMVSRPLEDLWPFLDRDELRQNMLVPLLPD
jgi:acetolactate synthase I/II/III large subunit